MSATAVVAATHYLIYSPGDRALVPLGLVIGPLFLIPGLVWWSGMTVPAYCRRLVLHPESQAVSWRWSVHNYGSARSSSLPGCFLWFGVALLSFAVGDLCAGVWWLHPIAWVFTAAALGFSALTAATFFVYPFVSFPKWLRPKPHRYQVLRAGRGESRAMLAERNRATLISLYVDPDDIETFERTGVPPPRRLPDPAEDWLRAQGPLGEQAADELKRQRNGDDELQRERGDELRRQGDVETF